MNEKKDNIVLNKSFDFAIRVVNLYKFLLQQKEMVLSKQLLKSGTSVGANVREALHAESKTDFIHKLSIAQKEMADTAYWLDLLRATDYLNESVYSSIKQDADELGKIITSIIVTTKKNLTSNS
jgi:four helix bundle protein